MTGEIVLILRLLLTAALFAFVGYAFYILWMDLRQQSTLVSKKQIPSLRLTWQMDGKEASQLYADPTVMIGRDPLCECPLLNDTVSARHARLVFHHRQWWLEDMNSKNGTFLNDEPLYTPTVIESGDEIRCGQISLSISLGEKA